MGWPRQSHSKSRRRMDLLELECHHNRSLHKASCGWIELLRFCRIWQPVVCIGNSTWPPLLAPARVFLEECCPDCAEPAKLWQGRVALVGQRREYSDERRSF